jgi:hypothetical protein
MMSYSFGYVFLSRYRCYVSAAIVVFIIVLRSPTFVSIEVPSNPCNAEYLCCLSNVLWVAV